MKKTLMIIACAVSLVGCASSGPVPIGKDTYMITKQSAGGMFVSPSSIEGDIIREANAFCGSQGKAFQLEHTNEVPAIPAARLPSAEIQFMCLNKDDPAYGRPKMQREPNLIIENRNR